MLTEPPTLAKIKVLKGSSSDAIEESFLVPQRNHSVKGFFKEPSLSYIL